MSERSPWVSVGLDASVAALLLALGIDPVFDLVSSHLREAAYLLGGLHMALIPWVFLTALLKADSIGVFTDAPKGRLASLFEWSFLLLLITGWMLPVFSFSIQSGLPPALFYGSVGAHVAPIFVILIAAFSGQGKRLDEAVLAMSRRLWLAGVMVGVYMAVAEVFFVKMRLHSNRIAPMAFVSWALAYLPIRLFFARLAGLRGPEWASMLSSMALLLVRLISLKPR